MSFLVLLLGWFWVLVMFCSILLILESPSTNKIDFDPQLKLLQEIVITSSDLNPTVSNFFIG